MSWSISTVAPGKVGARRLIEGRQDLPLLVRALLVNAIAALAEDVALVSIEGNGHQATGSDYAVSTCTFTVKPLSIETPARS